MRFFYLAFILFFSSFASAQKPVKGTWITNVASDALSSKEKIRETVQRCKQHGLNTIYVVTWNKGVTMYPSPVVEKYIGIKQDPKYKNFDPIKEIIAQGHAAGLRVIGWFEFGFSYDYGDSTGVWMQRYPHWAGRSGSGALLQKNKFFWWNALHPEVQSFMNELLFDFVQRYDADGIQGDDRLPAMPGEGGYDAYTKDVYAKAHNAAMPPTDWKDSAWTQWRADLLSAYIKDLHAKIKSIKPKYTVSWAPSIYPWAKEQYLQDWPAWLRGGYADEVLPQLYRYDINAYEKILKELDTQLTPAQKKKVFPGILTSLGDGYRVSPKMYLQMIALNRKYGFNGECTFYYEGLKNLPPVYKADSKPKKSSKKK